MNESDHLAAVLLAAGPSTRLGQPKQLVKVDGEALVRRMARLLLEAGSDEVTVVTGCRSDEIRAEIKDLPVGVAHNPVWEQGMGGSITCGVRHASEGADGYLVMVCDQWRLQADDVSRLIDTWKSDISRIVVASWKEGKAFVSGPPIIFPSHLLSELKFMTRSRGARQVIDRNMDAVEFVETQNAAWDLDRPQDLALIPGYG